MKLLPRLLLASLLAFPAALLAASDHAASVDTAPAGYPLRGVVTRVLADKKLVLIRHEEIPGFMKAMTMAFHVADEIYPHLTPGTEVVATMRPKQADGWHLIRVRVLAAAGAELAPGVPYRVTLASGSDQRFSGHYAFTPPAAGDWRVCVSTRAAWVDLVPPSGKPAASKACTHANPEGFAKGPLYTLAAGVTHELHLTKAPDAELDVLILTFVDQPTSVPNQTHP